MMPHPLPDGAYYAKNRFQLKWGKEGTEGKEDEGLDLERFLSFIKKEAVLSLIELLCMLPGSFFWLLHTLKLWIGAYLLEFLSSQRFQ